ncbi:MAG: hypothetical protein IBJ10_06255 [Phycisphaerales bacterium]|nr:hypothetical protein [Phycisphaerales bacterium]
MMTRNAWMRARNVALTGVAFAAAQTASASFILSDFVTTDEGWTSNVDSWQESAPRAGNDTGYLVASGDGTITPEAWAAPKFLGDQRAAVGGTFSFLANVIDPQLAHNLTRYTASVTLYSGADSITFAFAPTRDLVRTWGSFEVDLTASAWGVSTGEFNGIMSNLTGISLMLASDSTFAPFDVGFDQVMLTPTPGAAMLLGLAAPALLRRRRS